MEIKWRNILILAILILAIVLIWPLRSRLLSALSALSMIGPGHAPEDQLTGLICLALIVLAVVGITRIIIMGRKPDR